MLLQGNIRIALIFPIFSKKNFRMNKNIDVPRDELDRILDQFRKGKNSNFGLGEIYGQLHEVCEMQTALHQAHYNIDKVKRLFLDSVKLLF